MRFCESEEGDSGEDSEGVGCGWVLFFIVRGRWSWEGKVGKVSFKLEVLLFVSRAWF